MAAQKKLSISSSRKTATCGSLAENARRNSTAGALCDRSVPAPFLMHVPGRHVDACRSSILPFGTVPAGPPPPPQRKLRTVRFNLRNTDQFAFLDLPEVRYWLLWHRRVLIVNAAAAMLDGKVCSLNMAARLLSATPSSLCVWLQRFRAGGNEALKFKSPFAATGCRLSVYLRV